MSPEVVDCEVIPEKRQENRLVVLKSTGPVTLHLKTRVFLPDADEAGQAEFLYNEHTCPVNFLRNVVDVFDAEGKGDPHGVFEFVSIGPWVESE